MELLRTIVLIGTTNNEYIETVVSSSVNIFSLLMIPEKYIPSISGQISLERIKTSDEYS